MDGNFIREWESAKDAERGGGFVASGVYLCLNNPKRQHHGYKWVKLSDYNK